MGGKQELGGVGVRPRKLFCEPRMVSQTGIPIGTLWESSWNPLGLPWLLSGFALAKPYENPWVPIGILEGSQRTYRDPCLIRPLKGSHKTFLE